jgi:hypothetical protein
LRYLSRRFGKTYILTIINTAYSPTRGADKSLTRLTSRCRRMESIVSLERGFCSCAELCSIVFRKVRGILRIYEHVTKGGGEEDGSPACFLFRSLLDGVQRNLLLGNFTQTMRI